MKPRTIHWPQLLIVMLVVTTLFGVALYRIKIDTDILSVMPTDDPVIVDSAAVFKHHPMQNRIMIDIASKNDNPDRLVAVADLVVARFKKSGLFKTVGNEAFQQLMPRLLADVPAHLPILFTADELTAHIEPLLSPDHILRRMEENHRSLLSLDSIGQAALIAQDPLHFRDVVLARLAPLAPLGDTRFYRGHILSADGRHLLLTAQPHFSGTDTTFARKMTTLVQQVTLEIEPEIKKDSLTLTPLGAYRAALDNEEMIQKDVTWAIFWATAGITLLLIFAFPRPWIGLLSLLPAVAGTVAAFFVYSLFHDSISVMVLGFGGAIISITVDHGIAYLLFLDRPEKTAGKAVSEEVRSVGLLTVLTTIGAFGILSVSGFPVFVQLGQFAAMGIGFSFMFVHLIFPKLFPHLPPGRRRLFKFQKWVDRLAGFGPKGAWTACGFAVIMLFFAAPRFDVGMQSMNSISAQTQAAEKLITRVWGDLSNKVYLMIEGRDIKALQDKEDKLSKKLAHDFSSGVLSSGFLPSKLFPGHRLQKENVSAWQQFWTVDRVRAVSAELKKTGASLGFSDTAFVPFLERISAIQAAPFNRNIPPALIDVMGLSPNSDGSKWFQVLTLTTGPQYDAFQFRTRYATEGNIFDPSFFSERLGALLFKTFTKLLILVAVAIILLLTFFFLDVKLTLAALLPVLFALIATVGTSNLMGRPIDIPGLMLAVVVLGMGIDYSLFFVRSHQRYGAVAHPKFGLIRMAVFMAATSTLIGFGVLIFARHTLLKSAGLTSFLGIGYSLLGAFLILPPLLTYLQRSRTNPSSNNGDIRTRVMNRYRHMEAYPRFFTRYKLRMDPMFAEMIEFLNPPIEVRSILDVGSGYGVPGCWLLERFPHAFIYGIEPLHDRVRIAARAVGPRGTITVGAAPNLPDVPHPVDLAVMLDMAHFLNDDALKQVLENLYHKIKTPGQLVIRASVQPERKRPWYWWLENFKHHIRKVPAYYRSREQLELMIRSAGFQIDQTRFSGPHRELVWIMATAI